MRKKSIIVLLAVCALALTGCEKLDYNKAVGLYEDGNYEEAKAMFVELGAYEDSAKMITACDYAKAVELFEAEDYDGAITIFETIKDYEDSAEYIDNAEYKKIAIGAKEDSLETFGHNFYHEDYRRKEFQSIISVLKEDDSVEKNDFVRKLLECYDTLKFEEQSELSQDWLELYLSLHFWQGLPYDVTNCEVKRGWMVGYAQEEGLKATPAQSRILVLEAVLEDGEEVYILHSSEEHDSISYYYIEVMDDFQPIENVLGIDKDAQNGICSYGVNVHRFFRDFENVPYKIINDVAIKEMTNYYDDILELMQIFKVEAYEKYVSNLKANEQKAEEARNAEPAIGMTKSEVLNGAWGSPDDKNIDEYEWGTHEQWVYDGKGYVYFEDGVVTSIQHR